MEMMPCARCGGNMPSLRFTKFGYIDCIKCSKVEKVGGVKIANHKTGNEIQIVPMEDAERINALGNRRGYGVCNGMKGNR